MALTALTRTTATGSRTDADLVAVEAPLTIVAGGRSLGVFMRTPGDDATLALGLLYAEGVIRRRDDVVALDLTLDADGVSGTLAVTLAPGVTLAPAALDRAGLSTTACGLCGRLSLDTTPGVVSSEAAPDVVLYGTNLVPAVVFGLPEQLRAAQRAYAETGGLHAAAFVTPEGALVDLAEDVGRHNAVDKIVGRALEAGALPARDRWMVVSGRVAFEIVQKAARAGVAALIAIGAPTSLAVQAAREARLPLVGFVKDGSYNVYV